jgi:broad specificity phosphatase PhoE
MIQTGIGGTVTDLMLVRHAKPNALASHASHLWHLSPDGRAAARQLARKLPANALVLTSEEPKAVQTAEEISAVGGGEVRVEARVREARRPHRWDDRYRDRARRYVGGQRYIGWEPQEAVARRFDEGVRAGLELRDGSPLVVVNHGLALTLWLQSVGAVADVETFWSALAFPDAWCVGVRSAGGTFLATELERIPI